MLIVDPIDGTRGFSDRRHALGGFDRTGARGPADRGRGARAGARGDIHFGARRTAPTSMVARSTFPAAPPFKARRFPARRALCRACSNTGADIVPFPKLASLAMRLVRIASGRIDAGLVGDKSYDWDIAGRRSHPERGRRQADRSRRRSAALQLRDAAPCRACRRRRLASIPNSSTRRAEQRACRRRGSHRKADDDERQRNQVAAAAPSRLRRRARRHQEHAFSRSLATSTSSASIPNFAEAKAAWKAKAQATVDNAHMRYFVVHLHRLLEPSET